MFRPLLATAFALACVVTRAGSPVDGRDSWCDTTLYCACGQAWPGCGPGYDWPCSCVLTHTCVDIGGDDPDGLEAIWSCSVAWSWVTWWETWTVCDCTPRSASGFERFVDCPGEGGVSAAGTTNCGEPWYECRPGYCVSNWVATRDFTPLGPEMAGGGSIGSAPSSCWNNPPDCDETELRHPAGAGGGAAHCEYKSRRLG
ncbi:hypothetical protein RAS1_18290 [Phycisphaerae bacterium RAS1]|nr:hypothetical protein RAS1_18290 [Phycisphaerae bacterium RAS1]